MLDLIGPILLFILLGHDNTTNAFKAGSTQKDPFVVEFKTACPRNRHPTILKLRAYGAMTSPINFNLLLVIYKT